MSLFLLILAWFFASFFLPIKSIPSDCHVYDEAYIVKVSYYVDCGFWGWGSCTNYQYVTQYRKTCCLGWTNLPDCTTPLCDGKTNPLACTISYNGSDMITYVTGFQQTNSGGFCSDPDTCINCNDGFYSTGMNCTICPSIPYCHHRRCSNTSDNYCAMCYYENVPGKRYDRAYKYDPDVDECRKTCSWRTDSTRCFPGYCSTEFTESCNCTAGFSGTQCNIITQPVEILEARSTFHGLLNSVAESPKDINKPKAVPKYWTNNVDLNELELYFVATYKPLDTIPDFGYHNVEKDSYGFTSYSHYVVEFKYGITRGEVQVRHIRNSNWTSLFYNDTMKCNSSCHQMSPCPVNQHYLCKSNGKINITNRWEKFQHNDEVHITLELENGGYVKYENRDNKTGPVNKTDYLTGVITTETYEFHWDIEEPFYHCNEQNCSRYPINVTDITKTNIINVFWNEWSDGLAGIDFYELEVYELHGEELMEDENFKTVKRAGIKGNDNRYVTFTLTKAGMYSIIFRAFDKAENFKSTRALVLYDDLSKVEIYNGSITVDKEVRYLEKTWITFPGGELRLQWTDRFINVRHVQNYWLNRVKTRNDVVSEYDDNTGKRTIEAVANARGIIRFEVAYFVYGLALKLSSSYLPILNVMDESVSTVVSWEDGDMVKFSIRAFDIFDDYLEDNVTIFRDSSPPVVSNLWLTRGNRVNIYVHNIEEFALMTIEWDAFDYNSGISHLKWRLYDNYTGSDVVHGEENIYGQGDTETLTECQEKYGNSPRGPSCYCTMYTGCYHQHFYVQPKINTENGLRPDKYKGTHDYDYYIEVKVTNMAELEVAETKKITIDVSPPIAGFVLDGIPGSLEIDFQQDLHLFAHWEGFVDHESGVQFYQYEFSTSCLSKEYFQNKSIEEDTFETTASFYAPKEGTFYVTVVAYNRANEMSEPVCSDGVTVSTVIPSVKNVVVKSAKTYPRLFIDRNKNAWFLDDSVHIHRVENITDSCKFSTILHEDIDIFPMSPITVNGYNICNSTIQYTERVTRVLSKVSQLEVTWNPGIETVLIDNYEVGLSSTTNNPFPDIAPFQSSKHHTHILINHFGIPEGNLFFIIIRSISKSSVAGSQSLGPYIMDTSHPEFVGNYIDINLYDTVMVANWSLGAFRDMEDPYPLTYEFSIGNGAYQTDVQGYLPIRRSQHCKFDITPTCVAVNVSQLKWQLHEHHEYFFSIKATNLADLSVVQTSRPYLYDIQLPTSGIVIDIPINSSQDILVKELVDIDYTDKTESLAVRWYNFYHPHLSITYFGCVGTVSGKCDEQEKLKMEDDSSKYTFRFLKLNKFKKYFVTIFAETTTGTVNISTDGIFVVNADEMLSDVYIIDGSHCSVPIPNGKSNSKKHINRCARIVIINKRIETTQQQFFFFFLENINMKSSHSYKDSRPACKTDLDFQTSVTVLNAYWEMSTKYLEFITHGLLTLEVRHWFGEFWDVYNSIDTQYIEVHRNVNLSVTELNLIPGRKYRFSVQFCADYICFPPVTSNGISVIPNEPSTGKLSVTYIEDTKNKVILEFTDMYDPDIQDEKEARNAIDYYEYTAADELDRSYHSWLHAVNITKISSNHSKSQIIIDLDGKLDLNKCKKYAVRGYNKAGVYSTISAEIKTEISVDNHTIAPRMVIDAIGEQEKNRDGLIHEGYGREIYLEENGKWQEKDAEYTPYKNILSATWDSLKHKDYTFAVIEIKSLDSLSYYQRFVDFHLPDPCSHPDAIRCGHTEREYVNIFFSSENYLEHGKRYAICIHAPSKLLKFEEWYEELNEVNECSDGISVDLTPPIPGRVWIGWNPTGYLTSTSDMYVTWDSFIDVEEDGQIIHSSGIKEYHVAIGSVPGGSDVNEYTHVGVVNHKTFHKLSLQNGHIYYASVRGIDFTNRSSVETSAAAMVDHTPPEQTSKSIIITWRHITSVSQINACWQEVFLDNESGIKNYLWAVGTKPKFDNIMQYTETTEDCVLAVEDFSLQNGRAYFFTVKAVNKAGLSTSTSSWGFIYDMSPPETGYVFDGTLKKTDIDFQTDISELSVSWDGFHDPHIPIKYFKIGVGTCIGCDDLLQTYEIGVIYNYTLRNTNLVIGVRYFTTITACNVVDLCNSVTSDGVVIDNSPPTVGLVKDGTENKDINYQPLKNFISASWQGFSDPHSGLEKFVVRAGTKIGGDDIITPTDVQMSSKFVLPNMKRSMPTNTRIYFTIRAFNKAGLYSEATSNGFLVDDSLPIFLQKPKLDNTLGSVVDKTLIYRSCFKAIWDIKDDESFIERQYISMSSHQGGEINATSKQIPGIVREYTFTSLDLHDGGEYLVKLISCNGARLCVEAESHRFIVDNSPPVAGMFAVHTDHAANLNRHVPGWMMWSKYKLWLSWLGFSDVHSGIEYYVISIGSTFMMQDLSRNQMSVTVFHNDTPFDKHDEGTVQTFEIDTVELSDFGDIFISLWAVNKVGLKSDTVHNRFSLIKGGSLDVIRRCSSDTCLGHCVCSARSKRCDVVENTCADKTKNNRNTELLVFDIINFNDSNSMFDVDFTPSNDLLAAKWSTVYRQGLSPKWYEWSVGLSNSEEPEGIIDNALESVWHPCGQCNNATYTLPRGKKLTQSVSYSFFVRVWYNSFTFADFKSDGVVVMSKSLTITTLNGAGVNEQVPGHWQKDIDYMPRVGIFTVSWTNAFQKAATIIKKFHVYISTFSGGHDIHAVDIDIPGSTTSVNISHLTLHSGVLYYSNVVGYSYAGQYAFLSSDGFVVDDDKPITGIVLDGIGTTENKYQNSSTVVAASWYGFLDVDSGIANYYWCVQSKESHVSCDILSYNNVGIQRTISRSLNTSHIIQGTMIVNKVYAVDFVGHSSDTVVSDGVVIDNTPPIPSQMVHVNHNYILNPSFEESSTKFVDIHNNTYSDNKICRLSVPTKWNFTENSCVCVLGSLKALAEDGRSFLLVQGSVSQTVTGLQPDSIYRMTFFVSHSPFGNSLLSSVEGFVQFGERKHIFHLYSKTGNYGTASNITWHPQTFYFTARSESIDIAFGSISTGGVGVLFDNVLLSEIMVSKMEEGNHVLSHSVWINNWHSIHASWIFTDKESPIVEHLWAIGYKEGSTEIQGYTSVGLNNFAYNYNVTLIHSSQVHVTVVAVNAAGLSRKATAEALYIDLTPPIIDYVYDGLGYDIDSQTTDEISGNWKVHDSESGISYCEWALGYSQLGNELQVLTMVDKELTTISTVFPRKLVLSKTVYVTLRCYNNAGLHSIMSSDGVTISDRPPLTKDVVVNIIGKSDSPYPTSHNYYGDSSSLGLKWKGFVDTSALESYIVKIGEDDKNIHLSQSVLSDLNDMMYCSIWGLNLANKTYSVDISAVNAAFLRSDPVSTNFSIVITSPGISDLVDIHCTEQNRNITISWDAVFTSEHPLYYEVSMGTSASGADIIQWLETTNTYLEIHVPTRVKLYTGVSVYVTITAVGRNGKYTTKSEVFML